MSVHDTGMGEPIRWDWRSFTAEELQTFHGKGIGDKVEWRGIQIKLVSCEPFMVEEVKE